MKILFLNPPFKNESGRFSREQRSPAITKGGTFYYPMWLCYAAGVLEQDGFEVLLIDAPASQMTLNEVLKKAQVFKPNITVVDTSTPSIYNDIEITEKLKQFTESYTILVGTHPSALPEETMHLSNQVDAIARREYEYTIRDLAGKFRSTDGKIDRNLLSSIAGLSFRWENIIIHNPDRPPIENLNELPFLSNIYSKHLDIKDYFYTIAQYPQVAIYSGRGCPHRCVYCVYPQVMHGHRYRKRSIQNLIDEFKFIEHKLRHVREIFIEDDTFTVDKKRVIRFSEAYNEAKLKISWIANSRADIDKETLQALKQCNCRLLCVGFESGDQHVLDTMKKHLKVADAKQFIENAKKVGILIHGCFIVGNPGETFETLEKTLDFAKRMNPDTAQFFPIMVYPGTNAYKWAKEKGYLISENYSKWNTEEGLHNCMVSRPELSNANLVSFCDRARKEFYLRPGYIFYRLKRLFFQPIEDGPRMIKSINVFKKFIFRGTFNR